MQLTEFAHSIIALDARLAPESERLLRFHDRRELTRKEIRLLALAKKLAVMAEAARAIEAEAYSGTPRLGREQKARIVIVCAGVRPP
ncbi:MAG: hypothetical protein ACR65U_08775 [Methylocystis sp.]